MCSARLRRYHAAPWPSPPGQALHVGQPSSALADFHQPGSDEAIFLVERGVDERRHELPISPLAEERREAPIGRGPKRGLAALG